MLSLWKDHNGDWHRVGMAGAYLLYGAMYTEPGIDLDRVLAEVNAMIPREIHWVGIKQTGCRPGIIVDIELWTPMYRKTAHRQISVVPLQLEARKNERALSASIKKFIKQHLRGEAINYDNLVRDNPENRELLHKLKMLAIIDITSIRKIYHYELYTLSGLSPTMKFIAAIADRKFLSRSQAMHLVGIKTTDSEVIKRFINYGIIERQPHGKESIYVWKGYTAQVRRNVLQG